MLDKKFYEDPQISILYLDDADILTASEETTEEEVELPKVPF